MKHMKAIGIAVCGLAMLAGAAWAGQDIPSEWYGDGGASSPYALVTRENEPGFSYTPSPEDWRDRNIYQLFTDRFATDGNNNLASYKPDWFYRNKCTSWGAIPRNFHQGGNWRGLRQQIGYLTNMGVTAVWISGVQLNDQAVRYGGSLEWRWTPYHQYHVDNFFRCEPASGTFQELKDLIDDLHKANIAVILDVAPNHMCDKCGRQGNNGNDDKSYTDWDDGWWWDSSNTHPAPFNDLARFHLNGTINNWDTSPENLKGQFKGTDDLKQEDGTTSDILYKAFKNLIDATDCDGFRVDAIKHIDYKWCRSWAQAMRDHAAYRGKNNFLVFGELFSFQHDALAGWCSDGYGFNASLDFPLMNAMNNAFGNGYSGYQLGEEMGYISSKYGKSANNVIAFLDNHDVNRFACSYGGGSKASAAAIMRPAMTFLYLAPPIPLLYYGTEHCFNQGGHGNGSNKYGTDNDPFYNPDDSDWQRECMFDPDATWGGDNGFQPGNAYGDMFSDGAKEAGLYYHIAWLNSLRNKSRALRRGGFAQRASVGGQGLYAFTKWYGDEVALVLLNTSDYDYKVRDYNSGWLEVGITNAVFKENGDGDVVGSSNDSGWIDLSGVTVSGKGTKIFICNFVDNSADVGGGGGGGGGGGSSLWANSTYVWPTEATSADTIYINTQVGNTNNIQSVKVIYGYKGQEGDWPFEEMGPIADWTPTQEGGAWYHYELPASQVSAGTLQFSICVSDGKNEFWDNNGGGDYLVEILPPQASIGATFGTVSASPSDPKEGESVTITAPMVADEGADTSQLWVKLSFAYATASGSTGTWTTVSMTKDNTYQGTTYFTTSIADLPGGKTLCYKLEAGNGGTDTIWANNGNAYRLKIAGTSTGETGNCWHCPTNHEATNECMRMPVTPSIGSRMVIRMGNYQGGDGTSAEHDPFDMTGGTLYYRFGSGDTWTSWESSTLYWNCRGGDNNFNNYWTNAPVVVPDGYAGQFLQYYFEVFYTNSEELATTYLYMNPDNSGTSLTTLSEAIARETPFEVGIAAAREGTEPGYVWHGGNITRASDTSVQIWAKIGYKPDGGDAWADEAIIRYRIDMKKEGKARSAGVKAIRSTAARAARSWQALTSQTNMTLQSLVADSAGKGQAMMWMGTITDERLADPDAVLIYEIYARNSKGTGFWRQAEYNIADGSCTFEYRMWSDGSGDLTVDGVSADYTTSKFFIDEAKGETVTVEVAYHAPDDADAVELFTNFGRRDYAEVDTDGDGWPDGMIPPDGNSVTADNCADGYWQAIRLSKGAGAYVTNLTTGKCGVYRITARYKAAGATNWTWYSENPNGAARRDHVVVISPKKAMEQRMYELNVLTTKATACQNDKSGNFEDLSERLSAGALDGSDAYGEFSLDYLNRMGINCLWFQPIHPNLGYERGNTNASGDRYWPGSPYATKNYFSVSHEMSKDNTEAAAVAAFTNFVRLCDKAQSDAGGEKKVGTINVMLDGVMNHTSFDAVYGEGIELALAGLSPEARAELTDALGEGWDNLSATNVIPATDLGIRWYSHVVDDTHNQADPATRYNPQDLYDNDIANAPERYDFGKWNDVAELLYGDYSTMVKYNDMSNVWVDAGNDYWYETTVLGPETSRIYSEEDQYYYGSMRPATKLLWKYMASYPEYWIKKTGNDGVNHPGVTDANGTLTDDYGIDGLRCDYAQGLPNQFWEYCINRTRSMKWNFLFMAESLDGGKVGFRSNRQFDILNENLVFRFTQDHVSDPGQLAAELENRRASYGNGLILLNETCHDEIIPWGDPQATASRYAMVSAVDGIPMIFYGQEQAISTFVRWWDEASQSWKGNDGYEPDDPDNANKWKGFQKFEQNFGKWIPHFKTWNKMLVWDEMVYSNNTPNASRDIAAFYGKINLARMNSPALRSKNRWFCYEDMNTKTYCSKIFFCAKWEEEGKSPNEQDAVFAAVLFLNDFETDGNDGHAGAGCTYDISAFASKMGIENRADRFYNVKNIASTNDAYVWDEPKSGKELYEKGFYVLFRGSHANGADLLASEWTDNGNVVQYLKVFDVTGEVPPVAPDGLTINDPAETLEVANGTASYAIVGMAGEDVVPGTVTWTNAQAGVGGSFAAATVWTQSVALATGTNVVAFSAETSGTGGTFTVLASKDGIGAVDGFANFTSNCTGTAGMFVHDNVSATDITGFENNHAFGLYAITGGGAVYTRMFDTDSDVLSAGVTLGMRYDNNNSTDKGVQFIDADGNAIFGLKHGDGEEIRYWYTGAEGTWSSGMGGATSAAFDVVLTKTATGYAVSGTKRDGGTFPGLTIETTAKVVGLKFWMTGVEDDPQYKDYRQLYFNNLTYTVEGGEPETVTATATIIVSDTSKSAPTITVGGVSPATPTVGQTVTIPVQATGDGNPTLALTDALLDGSTYTGATLADGSLTFVPALSGTYVFTLLATNTSEDGQTATATATVTVAAAVIQIDEIVDCTISGGKVTVTLKGDSLDGLTSVPVWVSDGFKDGDWGWKQYGTASVVDGEVQLKDLQITTDCLMISVGKPSYLP